MLCSRTGMPKAFPGAEEPLGQREQLMVLGSHTVGSLVPKAGSGATTGVPSAPGQEDFPVKRETEAGVYPHLTPLSF